MIVALLSAVGCGAGSVIPDGAGHSSAPSDYGVADLPAGLDAAGLKKSMLRSENLATAWEVGARPSARDAPADLPCRKTSGPTRCAGLKASGRARYDDPYQTGTISIDLQAYESRTAARRDYTRRKASLAHQPGRKRAVSPKVGNASTMRESVDEATGETTVTLVMRAGTVSAVTRYVCNDSCEEDPDFGAKDDLLIFATIQFKRIQYVQRGKTPPTRL
ncbi:hypothetical protein OIE63_39215 (plasmid) [Streptomyces sp. NBC_01795]|uniref:hypothetical protein n=1 Tax=unclassified Streptomyces TaxID=2593676 RepID=UPI002DD901D7|nr:MULTISPECIES: hypothetical protein [unclassified Streptomyces]WSA97561.1 hypothetical protein OIE63_39215 [Streptomyces sp. NBC_01795]WSB82191.1 hypothetical protein OHB04_41600 [Streptomyces sp. NBC_01775]WSS18162.1 hypothetical protein OG533_40680 [Streptomyces sp. NBC_01186]